MGRGRTDGADVVLRVPPGWTSDGPLTVRGPDGVRVTVAVETVGPVVDTSEFAVAAATRLAAGRPDLELLDETATSLAGGPATALRLAGTPPAGPPEAWLHVVAVVDGRAWTVTAVASAEATDTAPRLLEDAVAAVVGPSTVDASSWGPLLGRLRRGDRRAAGDRLARGAGAGPDGSTLDAFPEADGESRRSPSPLDEPDDASAVEAARVLLERAAADVVDEESLRGLTDGEAFEQAVVLLAGSGVSEAQLLHEASRDYWFPACAKLEAVARRPPQPELVDRLLRRLDRHGFTELRFVLRVLETHGDGPLIERILARAPKRAETTVDPGAVGDLVAARLAAGEEPDVARLWSLLDDEPPERLQAVLEDVRFVLPGPFVEQVDAGLRLRAAHALLRSVGRLDEGGRAAPDRATVLVTPERAAALHDLEAALEAEPGRSALVLGPPGSGRSTVIALLTARLRDRGWTVFEARAADLVAGQKHLGELEERVAAVAAALAAARTVWVVPSFADLYWAGRHQDHPRGVLDLLLPLVVAGRIRVVGEIDAGGYERLAGLRPGLRSAFDTVTIRPLDTEESLEVARRWVVREAAGDPRAWEPLLREALQLARHYLREERLPGSLLRLVEGARALAAEDDAWRGPPGQDHLSAVVSARTGMPVDLLDERHPLDLDDLRRFFERRVLGQEEAVTTLVDRVAMLKAGLTDPTRPQGVFLFVGPTGTGKTEIAKALAERVFGSPERLLRLDMSEFGAPDSLTRLTGEPAATEGGQALVDRIRAQPFSVVLLDEFEKAHPRIWDLFLQVFDDGRLTDAAGRTADFRHCLVIMTSNLGAAVATGGIGFAGDAGPSFAAASVRRAVEAAFRPELLNRLDRVVVFRPLSRATMRRILDHELAKVLERRGLRTREWAIEWDASAVEFLLERGFSPDLGARPLTRAIDRHLLAPLARTIVGRRYPEGDQFLFVRAPDGRALDVVFVDPDADDAGPRATAEPAATGLRAVALDPRGNAEEWTALSTHLARLRGRTETDDWERRKAETLRRTAAPGFWDEPDRFAVLGLAEYVDRLEAGLRGAESLLRRGTGRAARGRGGLPAELAGQLAARLHLLEIALDGLERGAPRDAFVRVRPGRSGDERAAAFAARLAAMYRRWAHRRGMALRVLEGEGDADAAHLLAVSGFAAHAVLAPEGGVHVLEEPRDATRFDRVTVHVDVAAQPEEPPPAPPAAARDAAHATLDREPAEEAIVRRYREHPSPLVRDAVRGWRTGRLDRVLDGDFDLLE